jgi:hypothetical protein
MPVFQTKKIRKFWMLAFWVDPEKSGQNALNFLIYLFIERHIAE